MRRTPPRPGTSQNAARLQMQCCRCRSCDGVQEASQDDPHMPWPLENALSLLACACTAERRRSCAAWPRLESSWLNAEVKATSRWRCYGFSSRRRMPLSRMRLQSFTLLRVPWELGGLRQGLNGPSGHGVGRMWEIMLSLLSGLCRFRWRRAGTWGWRR